MLILIVKLLEGEIIGRRDVSPTGGHMNRPSEYVVSVAARAFVRDNRCFLFAKAKENVNIDRAHGKPTAEKYPIDHDDQAL